MNLTWFEEIFEEYHTKKPCSSRWGARLFEFQLFFCSKEVFSNKGCKNTTNNWGKDENPNLLKGCATYQDSWCQATSWVHWKSSDVQAHKDHGHQGQTDYQTSYRAISLAFWSHCHDNQDKQESCDDFKQETTKDSDTVCQGIFTKTCSWHTWIRQEEEDRSRC